MSTTTNMGITKWGASDHFSYAELAANWDKVDAHDHTSGKGVQIPTAGIANNAITSAKISDGTIVNADINASAAIADSKLESSNNAIYRTVIERGGNWNNNSSSPIFLGQLFGTVVTDLDDYPFFSGRAFYFDPGDYIVAGKTTKIRLRGFLVTNNAAPSSSFTFRLSKIASTSDFVSTIDSTTLSATAISANAANTFYQTTSADLTAPSAGWYVLCCAGGGSDRVAGTCQLQLRHV